MEAKVKQNLPIEVFTNFISGILLLAVILKGYSEIIAVTTPSIFIKSEIFAIW